MDKLKNAEGLVRGANGKKLKQRYPKLGRGQIIPTAQALHRRMYTAFAEYVAFFPSPRPPISICAACWQQWWQRETEEIHYPTNTQTNII